MLRRTLTKWDQTHPVVQGPTPNVGGNIQPTSYTAYRNPRPTRSVSLILDTGGAALAKRVEYFYAAADPDTVNHSNSWTIETTTGLDRTLMTESHCAEGIDLTTAKTSSIDTLWDNYNYPAASSSETVYLSDPAYRDPAYRDPSSHNRYILGLITSVVLKDSTGQAVSKTETFYDEFSYPLITYSDLGSDPNYIDPVTTLRANPTTVRRYTNIAANTYLETHAQFDQYGNPVNFWDARGMQSQKEYAVDYRHAYLTKTTSAVPDPSGQYGSSSAITSSSVYDPVTGQVISTKDANDRETTFSYKIDASVSYKGLLTTGKDARYVVTTFKYDQLGRPYETAYSDGTPTLTSRYDQARTDAPPTGEQAVVFYNKGRLTEVTTAATASVPQTQQLYDYDLMGRARRQRRVVDANTYELRYTYNLGGGLVSERYPSGRVVSYGFDAAGRLSSIGSGSTTHASGMSYKPFGGLASMTLSNGTTYSMSYDDARLQLSSVALTQGSSVVQKYDYEYGAVNMADGTVDTSKNVGQIARVEGTIGTQRQWQQRFSYDTLGRLTSAGEYRGDTLAQTYLLIRAFSRNARQT